MASGTVRAPPSPKAWACLAVILLPIACGCSGSRAPALDPTAPATMRAVLALEAQAVLDADALCAREARILSDRAEKAADLPALKAAADLNRKCSAIAEAARDELLTGEAVLDAYEAGMQGRIACAVGGGVTALRALRDLLADAGPVAVPMSVTHAIDAGLALMSVVAPVCPVPTHGDGGVGG